MNCLFLLFMALKISQNNNTNNEGNDNRKLYIEKELDQSIFKKFDLLKILQNKSISIFDKIGIIEQSYLIERPSMAMNITMGGLFKDWYYDI